MQPKQEQERKKDHGREEIHLALSKNTPEQSQSSWYFRCVEEVPLSLYTATLHNYHTDQPNH